MPSGPIGICRRVVVVFLGATSVFHEDAQVASAAVGSALRVPTVTTLSQAAIDKAVREHARGQQFDDAEHPERRLVTYGLHPITKCIEGQSFSIVAPRSPQVSGCYSESGIGRDPPLTGEYAYALFDGAADDIDANITTAVVAFNLPGLQDRHLHWMLGSSLADNPATCMSILYADHSHHPADGPWICDFSGNGTDVVTANATEFSVTCGCSGSRTTFDRQAALLKERRKTEPHRNIQYPRHTGTASPSVDGRLLLLLATAVIALFVRIDNMRQINRIRRLQALISATRAEAGVELRERIAESLPLHSGGIQVEATEQ